MNFKPNPIALETAVVCVGILLLMAEAFLPKMDKRNIAFSGAAGLLAVLVASMFVTPQALPEMAPYARFYRADFLAMFFKQFMLVCTIFVLLMGVGFAPVVERYVPGKVPQAGLGEFFCLPLFTCAGLMWMVSAVDFVMIFVSLELVTISFYVLVGFLRRNTLSLEAGTKYLILGALSTGFIVYGITWIFGVTGTTHLPEIAARLPGLPDSSLTALLFGLALVLTALGFKVAAAPFQFWVPDVYQGAPTPITAFLSIGSKAAGFVVLMRVIEPFLQVPQVREKLLTALVVIAAITLIFGNLAAIAQRNMKRLLAYSSVAHAGYLLVGVASVGAALAGQAVSFYLAGYLIMTLLAFVVLIVVSQATGGEEIEHFKGLGKRSPWLAFGMLMAMVSLAGVPFTVGFIGKFFIFAAAVQQQLYILVVLGAITVGCGFYYYLKVVRVMYWQAPAEGAAAIEVPALSRGMIGLLVIAVVFFGIFPQPILSLLK